MTTFSKLDSESCEASDKIGDLAGGVIAPKDGCGHVGVNNELFLVFMTDTGEADGEEEDDPCAFLVLSPSEWQVFSSQDRSVWDIDIDSESSNSQHWRDFWGWVCDLQDRLVHPHF